MANGLYVALSAQMALEKRLNTIANNVANMNTPGYRAEEVKFESLMAENGAKDVKFASTGSSYTSRKAGPVTLTNSPYDVAVSGPGWLALQTPDGVGYTRDGRMRVTDQGALVSMNGYPVLDQGGAQTLIDPTQGTLVIGADGMMSQNGNQVGSIGMFLIPDGAHLRRYDNATMIPDTPATPVTDYNLTSMHQGYVEGSNVDAIMEMTRLIQVQRAFEQAASAISDQESSTTQAIRQLGPS